MADNNKRSDYISALRGISALSIIMFHLFALNSFNLGTTASMYILQLWMAVPLFFILSAYTLCLSNSKRTDDNLISFYLRRFFRIAPLFYFIIAVIILWKIIHDGHIAITTILANVFFVFNFTPQVDKFDGIILASWFIGVIMPFYFIFPLLIKISNTITKTAWIFIITLIISFLFRLDLHWMIKEGVAQQMNLSLRDIESYALCSVIVNIPYFMMGIGAFHIHRLIQNHTSQRTTSAILFVLALLALIGFSNMSDQYLLNPVPLKYLMSLFFIPLIFSLFINEKSLIINKFTIFFGKISYSSYLIHVLLITKLFDFYKRIGLFITSDWLAFICCYVLTVFIVILISLVTYNFIELPGVRIGFSLEKRLKSKFPSAFQRSVFSSEST